MIISIPNKMQHIIPGVAPEYCNKEPSWLLKGGVFVRRSAHELKTTLKHWWIDIAIHAFSMVTDQFGMIGLLAFLKAAETDPNLASVTFGTDLTALGLDLTAADKLHPSYAGPWTDQTLKVYEIDYPVPSEYLVNCSLKDKLTQITLKRYHEDTIFFLFYMFPNDVLQVAAAVELYSREWRYHKEEKVWITRAPGINPSEKTNSYERGTYYIFDAHLWRRVPREFVIQYDLLESKPTID